jgi:hypothetical protein
MYLLIPYVYMPNHVDPDLNEFTYGDGGARARRLLSLQQGDFIFFHTTIKNRKYITAYFVVQNAIESKNAADNRLIREKYRNPHIARILQKHRAYNDNCDAIVFGDPILSRTLIIPIPFDRRLVERLSIKVPFRPGRSDSQAIVSATRAWRELTTRDVRILLSEARHLQSKSTPRIELLTTEEVSQVIERNIEDHIAAKPTLLGEGLVLQERQFPVPSGRIDLLLRDKAGNLVVVEVKQNRIGHDALQQVRSYVTDLRVTTSKKVSGILVCPGIMQAFEFELAAAKNVKIYLYGWQLQLRRWEHKRA